MQRSAFGIKRLHIQSFRGIDDLTLQFALDTPGRGGLAVLAGDNGCGKTSVLEAIACVLGQQHLLRKDSAPLDQQVRFGSNDFTLEVELCFLSDGTSALALKADSYTLQNPTRREFFVGKDPADVPSEGFWEAVDRVKPRVEYFSAQREPRALGTAPLPGEAELPREAHRIVDLKKKLISAYYRSLRMGNGGKMPDDTPFVRLQRFVQSFLGEDQMLDVLPVDNNPGSGDDVVIHQGPLPGDITSMAMARAAAPSRSDIPSIVPLDRLSSGQVALFAFAGPLIFRDAPADVVLIDEPEQHLHVQWQRQLMGALRDLSPESQFIVATHSLEVLDSALSHERFFLVRDDDPRAQPAIRSSGGWLLPKQKLNLDTSLDSCA